LGDSREAKMVRWFSDGWWIARPHAKGAWVGDLRFGEGRRWGDKKSMVDSRLVFAWDILPGAENGEHLRGLSSGRDNPEEVLKRLARRAVGDREAWEANPRLAGVTGSLPEFLAVEE
jgi:hypothetical protein